MSENKSASASKGTPSNTPEVKARWFKPVNRLGRITLTIAMVASFFPFMYLFIRYGDLPSAPVIFTAIGGVAAAYGAAWIVEPVSYFPALGTAGTYMGILAGSIGQMRVPAAVVAKSVAGVEENTQEAEIVSTCGIAGSVFMNIIILTATAVGGTLIISILPEKVLAAMTAYILPAIFGAVLAMFTGKGRLQLTGAIFAVALLINIGVTTGILPLPAWSLMIITIVLGILIARLQFVKGWVK